MRKRNSSALVLRLSSIVRYTPGAIASRIDLDPGSPIPVAFESVRGSPGAAIDDNRADCSLPRTLCSRRMLSSESHHYSHYDFLYSLSDQIQQPGLEHHQSSENGTDPEAFTEWDKTASTGIYCRTNSRILGNGKFRRPADLWTPNYADAEQSAIHVMSQAPTRR